MRNVEGPTETRRNTRRKPSPRTDATEQALRRWLVQRHYRSGDRLPADIELAQMLGVARSTVIAALDRLEDAGLIVRRQGSGTFVDKLLLPESLGQGLEVLGSYVDQARRRGVEVTLARAEIATGVPAPLAVADALRLPPGTPVVRVRRVLSTSAGPCALLVDHVPADLPIPDPEGLAVALADGRTLLDEMLDAELPVAYAQTALRATTVTPDEDPGRALAVRGPCAAMEVRETTHLASGSPVKHSVDVLLSQDLELTLFRHLPVSHLNGPQPLPPRLGATGTTV